jgi:hypothetical protein
VTFGRAATARVCSFPDCGRPHAGRGLCHGHNWQRRKGRPLTPIPVRIVFYVCTFPDCGRPHSGRGLCSQHCKQQRAGQPLTPLRLRIPGRVCSFPKCSKPHNANGLCDGHDLQRRDGRPLTPLRELSPQRARCARDGCPWPYGDTGHCADHQDAATKLPARRRTNLRNHYRLEPDDYLAKLQAQDNTCAVCRRDLGPSPHVDHDHECCPGSRSCGKCIRDLLCGDCNVVLGIFQDNPARLRAAADYLERHQRPTLTLVPEPEEAATGA